MSGPKKAGKNARPPAQIQVVRKHAMKPKISFDKKAIGKFFLEHSEKVVLGAFILVFAGIIYGAVLRREKFDKATSDLASKCAESKQNIENKSEEKVKSMVNELMKDMLARDDKGDYKKDAEKIAAINKQGISVKPYECDVALDKPLFGQRGKREQPEIYDVEGLRADADFGAFLTNAAPAAENPDRTGRENTGRDKTGRDKPGALPPMYGGMPPMYGGRPRNQPRAAANAAVRGKHWVVITGLVPWEKQANAYRKAFSDSVDYNPVNDVPTYAGYTVERAEINSPADEKNPNFKKIFDFPDNEKEATKDWPQQQQEVVDIKYTDPILTFPLGPLQNRTWGNSVAHETEIPLMNAGGTPSGAPEGDNVGDRANPYRGVVDPRVCRGAKIEARLPPQRRLNTNCCVFSIFPLSRVKVTFIE